MSNPFDSLKVPSENSSVYEEWGGQFSCSTRGCDGWANVARYIASSKLLRWQCQHGHESVITDVQDD